MIDFLKPYNCEKCKNTQWLDIKINGNECVIPCECQNARKTLENAQNSGLGYLLNEYTFDRYNAKLDWQQEMKTKAEDYIKNGNGWFGAFGQSGTGKSHLCVAICREFLQQGKEVVFMSWLDESGKLKRSINELEFQPLIDRYKNAEILYIDDFFKSQNNEKPTNADIKLANEILNYRYNKAKASGKSCKTLISSERSVLQLIEFDEAIAGRIAEMCGKYIVQVSGREKNYRLKGLV